METSPESPSHQIAVFPVVWLRAVVEGAAPFLFLSPHPRQDKPLSLSAPRCVSRATQPPRRVGKSHSFSAQRSGRLRQKTGFVLLTESCRKESIMRLPRQHPASQHLPPGTRSPSAQTHSGAGLLKPAHPQLRPTAQIHSRADLLKPSHPQLRFTTQTRSAAGLLDPLTLSSDPQRSRPPTLLCHRGRGARVGCSVLSSHWHAVTAASQGLFTQTVILLLISKSPVSTLLFAFAGPGCRGEAVLEEGQQLKAVCFSFLCRLHPFIKKKLQKTPCPKAGLSCQTQC